ncbi:YdeI family protein [uncultured Mesonia sp.]|uniref:YdeI/OmpD-associated family protein n=1 Tax=uncultured Mesonia sp. TaxID=399731 RepID=UPI00374EBF16
MDPVKEYITKHEKWSKQLQELRMLLLKTPLEETIKWGSPVYTLNNKNVIGLGAFKNHCALWFFKGSLLQKNQSLLINAQEGKTKNLRQIRFKAGDQIPEKEIKAYILEAIAIEQTGVKSQTSLKTTITIPPELQAAFDNNTSLKTAFEKLSIGKKREYCQYISEAKRASTKTSRLEKITPMILALKGLHDKYRKS